MKHGGSKKKQIVLPPGVDLYPGTEEFKLKFDEKTNVLTIVGTKRMDFMVGTRLDDILKGQGGEDTLHSGLGNDKLIGGRGPDRLVAGEGRDILKGGPGKDVLYGGWDKDSQTGGKGADVFFFGAADTIALKERRDIIKDFKQSQKDKIHLSNVFDFDFIGKAEFSETVGELRYEKRGKKTFVWGDEDGDGEADFGLEFKGSIDFKRKDFVLEPDDFII